MYTGARTREGIGVSEYVRWTHEQPMVEASLNEAGERLQPAQTKKQKVPA